MTFMPIAAKYGMKPFSEAGNFNDWQEAFDRARDLCREMNAPIEVRGYGMQKVFFPEQLHYGEK